MLAEPVTLSPDSASEGSGNGGPQDTNAMGGVNPATPKK